MAKKQQETEITYYLAQTHLVNDLTGREYGAGDTVTSRDFSPAVIENWLEIGALIVKPDEPEAAL